MPSMMYRILSRSEPQPWTNDNPYTFDPWRGLPEHKDGDTRI